MKRITTLVLVCGLAAAAMALSGFSSVFNTKYNVSKTSNLGKLGCAVCHASPKGGKLNSYGRDVKTALNGSKKLTPAVLAAVEGMDSNKDGVKNGDSIRADKAPGN